MIGFYIIKHAAAAHASSGQHTTAAALKQQQLYESAFVPMAACEAELLLPAGSLLLVPCTYAPGVKRKYCLSITTAAAGFTCTECEGGLAAAAAAAAPQARAATAAATVAAAPVPVLVATPQN